MRSNTGSVAVRIKALGNDLTVGRQFDETDTLVSNVNFMLFYFFNLFFYLFFRLQETL